MRLLRNRRHAPKHRSPRGGMLEKIKVDAGFIKEFVTAPLHVGSICPSGKALTAMLVRMAHACKRQGLVVDLGAGSGIVTAALLQAGVPPERIVAVEISDGFSQAVSRLHPEVPILTRDARRVGAMLAEHAPGQPICSIISSLPLRVIPAPIVTEIARELQSVLAERGGMLVQYSSAWGMQYPLRKYGLSPRAAGLVMKNIPPARVESYVAAKKKEK